MMMDAERDYVTYFENPIIAFRSSHQTIFNFSVFIKKLQ